MIRPDRACSESTRIKKDLAMARTRHGFGSYLLLTSLVALTASALSPTAAEGGVERVQTGLVWWRISNHGDGGCGIRTDHGLWCWGLNDFGQLGFGDTASRHV